MNTMRIHPAINVITLGTHDVKKAAAFYEQGLGFPRMPLDDTADIAFFTLNGSWLALYPWDLLAADALTTPQSTGFRGITLAHTVEHREEVLYVLETANKAGGRIIKPAEETSWGGFSGYFSDLDGHLWEVACHPFFWPGPKKEETFTTE